MLEVETEAGWVRGVRDGRTGCWRGVPYAAAPTGVLRFRPPAPPSAWAGVRDASTFGPAALQPKRWRGGTRSGSSRAEDCLHLSIWSPAADGRRRPVLVWVHGGGFVCGSGALHRGEPLAAGGDIVVVTLNYRLGLFGFVDFGPALGDPAVGRNLGLQDVAAALGWVRRNIAGFGGDPARVTLAGHGAGATLVSLLLRTPAARLFDAAILQGGSLGRVHAPPTAARVAHAVLDRLEPRPRSLADLRAIAGGRLLAAAATAIRQEGVPQAAPVFDGVLLPASLAEALDAPTPPIPLLVGMRHSEALRAGKNRVGVEPEASRTVPFAPLGGEKVADRPDEGTVPGAAPLVRRCAPTWLYRFDYAHPLCGARPGLELLFLWPFPGVGAALRRGGFLTGLRSGLSERMRAAWTSFVRTGDPGEDWPPYQPPDRFVRLFALQDRVVSEFVRAESRSRPDHRPDDALDGGPQARP